MMPSTSCLLSGVLCVCVQQISLRVNRLDSTDPWGFGREASLCLIWDSKHRPPGREALTLTTRLTEPPVQALEVMLRVPPAPEPQTPMSGTAPAGQGAAPPPPPASLTELPKAPALHMGLVPKLEGPRAQAQSSESSQQGAPPWVHHLWHSLDLARVGTAETPPCVHDLRRSLDLARMGAAETPPCVCRHEQSTGPTSMRAAGTPCWAGVCGPCSCQLDRALRACALAGWPTCEPVCIAVGTGAAAETAGHRRR